MELIRLFVDDKNSLSLSIHWIIWAIAIIVLIVWVILAIKKSLFINNVEIDSAELGINGQKIKIKHNHINIYTAYNICV